MARVPVLPTDPLFPYQWHLLNSGNTPASVAGVDINVIPVWADYTGRGVLVGVMDQGMDDTHPDLIANYRADLAWDLDLNEPGAGVKKDSDKHGVPVAGLISAVANNGLGGVGVAWNSNFTMYRSELDGKEVDEIARAYHMAATKMVESGIDISSHSWGLSFVPQSKWAETFHSTGRHMAEFGRDGRGIVTMFAAGNSRIDGLSANLDPTDSAPWVIVVAASAQNGDIAEYSTPGAPVLISSPGSGFTQAIPRSMVTTDRQGEAGYNTAPGEAGDYEMGFNGTSAATPVAAGVLALMLEANSRLGYRDVQEILAYSAARATFLERDVDQAFNGARDWNGGALLGSHDFGYGNIDAHAAVRLAETWTKQSTVANLVVVPGMISSDGLGESVDGTKDLTAMFLEDHRVEHVLVSVKMELDMSEVDGLKLELLSPSGTVSELIDFSLIDSGGDEDDDEDGEDGDDDILDMMFGSVRHWGESLAGEWTLRLSTGATVLDDFLLEWSIQAHTTGSSASHTQFFTDDYTVFAGLDASRTVVHADHGRDLNAAAVTENVRLDLATGDAWIGETKVILDSGNAFRNLFTGDGDDVLVGNAAVNVLMAGRGNNHVDGGAGVDVARFIGGRYDYQLEQSEGAVAVHSTIPADHGTDLLYNVEILHFQDEVVLASTPQAIGIELFDEAGYLSQNPDVAYAVQTGQFSSGHHHYMYWGAQEGRNPNALFDEAWYLHINGDVAEAVDAGVMTNGFVHYQHWGWAEGRSPAAWMDTGAYLEVNPDVADAGMNPLQHFLLFGLHEGRAIIAHDAYLWL